MTPGKKFLIYSLITIVGLVVVIQLLPFGTVGAGERGVVLRFGAVTGKVHNEGLYFRTPFAEKVHIMDVKVQKDEVNASAASKDLQNVSAKVAVNYHLDAKSVAQVYQTVGDDFNSRLIAPAIQESVKAATAKYTAEELITKRATVRDDMEANFVAKLQGSGIIVDEFNIIDFDFSDEFNRAIELKVKAEQDAKTAENKLKQVEAEAKQQVAKAQAEAESIRLQGNAANSENYIRLKELEVELERARKWNGTLPQNVYGSAPIPFLNVGK